jgi:hypothetical protein
VGRQAEERDPKIDKLRKDNLRRRDRKIDI